MPLIVLAEKFASLPGIGLKTAHRLAYHITKMSEDDVRDFAAALIEAKVGIHTCKICQNFTEKDICTVCSDTRRDKSTICVVENPKDVSAFEKLKEYNGSYHVLHGLLSPVNGITPENLRIKELLQRIQTENVQEVIMATNPTVEGDTTALYISRLLKPLGIKVTRIAFGLPVGGQLEYADEVTLNRALCNRNEI